MRKLLSVVLFSAVCFVGCSEDDKTAAAPAAPLPQLKPLPPCEEKVAAELQTPTTPAAKKRTIRLGYRENVYPSNWQLFQGETRPNITLSRGITYYLQVTTVKLDNTSDWYQGAFYVPTCEEREQYQELNRKYEEPIRLAELK
jgi:hypothetical protein